jgi:hypothetical protein
MNASQPPKRAATSVSTSTLAALNCDARPAHDERYLCVDCVRWKAG